MSPTIKRLGPVLLIVLASAALAQDESSPRQAAPVDVTGYWVSVVTEDWRWRMQTPPKGDYASIPLNDEGRRVADTWSPDSDGGTCRPYGAAALMRMPMRIRVGWDEDDTLKLETDHGMQTRMLYFNADEAAAGPRSRQGNSVAEWDGASLKVVTTNMLPGYLRWNGVPYSENAVLTEYFDRHAAYDEEWMTVTAIVTDPTYLLQEYITSSSFKKLEDGSSWYEVSCEER